MADRYTVLNGGQIKDTTITEDDLNASVAGNGLSGGAGSPLALDLNELTDTTIDVANDSFAFLDNDDSGSKRETVADFVSAIAGSGLTATNGVLSANAITDNIVESDIIKEDLTSSVDGIETDFTLANVPLSASLDVYLNGQYQAEGTGKDYELNPDSGQTQTIRFAIAPESDAKLTVRYTINN